MKRGQRVIVTRHARAGRPLPSDKPTEYTAVVVKSNGSTLIVQMDNNGPRVHVPIHRVRLMEPATC